MNSANRLYHVNDVVGHASGGDLYATTPAVTDDINYTNNYGYTAIGELERDNNEGIEKIEWRVDSKIAYIYRVDDSDKDELAFDYDAMGNRIAKHTYTAVGAYKSSTFYVRDASGNVMGTYQTVVDALTQTETFKLIERPIYGSSRVGLDVTKVEWIVTTGTTGEQIIEVEPASVPKSYTRELGHKQYELSNHLGNVLVVVNDIKRAVINNNTIEYYTAQVVSATDYSPFGVTLEGRTFSSEEYRYGFNGKERDTESFEGAYDFGARILDARFGRWLSIDMLVKKYAAMSGFNYALNNPIIYLDPDGNDIVYFDEAGSEIVEKRVVSNTVHETYIRTKQAETLLSIPSVGYELKSTEEFTQIPMPERIVEYSEYEKGKGRDLNRYDHIIAVETYLFNQAKNNGELKEKTEGAGQPSSVTDLDVNLVKAMVLEETNCGYVETYAWKKASQDVMQSNVGSGSSTQNGDWSPAKARLTELKEKVVPNPQESIRGGIHWLYYKGVKVSEIKRSEGKIVSAKVEWTGGGDWGAAAKAYNGGGNPNYSTELRAIMKALGNNKSVSANEKK
jgi:RHS repeat-associated protein